MSPVREPHSIASRALLASAFFVSGAAALAYEVAWSRALLLVLGSTAASSAVVLGTFVGALGFGARWGGRRAERHVRPLLLYGVLEIGAGLWALAAVPVASLLETPYVALAAGAPGFVQLLLRVLVAVIVIAPAAFLLGATLPAMVRHWVRIDGDAGRQTAWLYGANTLGAVAGCLYTGFVAVAAWGVTGTVWRAALVAIGVGIVTAAVGMRQRRTLDHEPRAAMKPVGQPERGRTAALVALFCGFVGLGIEVVGFRILVFFLEGFTVTFAAMLGVFILGLGLGSLILGPVLVRTTRPARTIGALLLLTSATLLFDLYVVIPSLEHWMHTIRDKAYAGAAGPEDIAAGLRWTALGGSALLFLVPSILLGPTFALCVRWAELSGAAPGHAVGRTYLWNSGGSLLAPLVCGFVLMPLFHVSGTWFLLAILVVPAGILLAGWKDGDESAAARSFRPLALRLSPLIALGCAALLLAAGVPGADAESLVRASVVMHDKPERTFVHASTDSVTTASVIGGFARERYLYTDDFAAAATGRHYRYMRMLGHLPVALAKKPENVMVIAFGTGTTAGAVAAHPEVKRLEVVEVSTSVLELADYFREANRGVLEDERTVVVPDDGRNALLLHAPDLDVITLEPLMPYAPAGYPFYTQEFYELAKARLREGGVLCQWIPVHAMPAKLYAAFLRAFYEVFPDGSLWFFEQSTVLIGRKGSTEPDADTIATRLAGVAADLRAAGLVDMDAVLGGYVAEGRAILADQGPPGFQEAYGDRPLVDMDPFPEFAPTPRASLNTPYLHTTLAYLLTLVDPQAQPDFSAWTLTQRGGRIRRGTQQALAARWKQAQGDYLGVAMRGLPAGTPLFDRARDERLDLLADAAVAYQQAGALLPGNRVLDWRMLQVLRARAAIQARRLLSGADAYAKAGREQDREEALRQAVQVMRAVMPGRLDDPDPIATGRIEAVLLYSAALLRLGRCEVAERVIREARADLDDPARGRALDDALDTLTRWKAAGGTPAPVGDVAWVFRGAKPCREGGLAPVRDEHEALRAAVAASDAELRRIRTAARRLAAAATDEGVERAVAQAWAPSAIEDGVATNARVVIAAMRRKLDPLDQELGEFLEAEDPALRAAALREAARWKLVEQYLPALGLAKDAAPAVRRALAYAASESGNVLVLRIAVDLLMDEDLDVRSDAWSAFLKHRPDQVERYDPKAPAEKRKPIYEALKETLGGA